MTILLDAGPLIAWLFPGDSRHSRASGLMRRIMNRQYGAALGTDVILDEGLTFLRSKVRRRETSEDFARLFFPGQERPVLDWIVTDQEVLAQAKDIHFQHFDRGLSFTDCVLIAHARRLGAAVATFHAGFDGLVEVVRA